MKSKECYPKFFWPVLVVFGLIGQIAWVIENMYLNVFIYKMFAADAKAISTMVAASAIAATLTTIFMGALSDKVGKRKVFICGGYILWGISIVCFGFIRMDIINALFPAAISAAAVGVSLVIIFDCIMTFFGSTANDACFNAWLTDATNNGGRGAAEGVNSMMPLIAILAVFGGFMSFNLDMAESWTTIFLIIGIAVIIIGALGFFFIKEETVKTPENSNFFSNIIYGFNPFVIKKNPILYITLLGFAIFGISIQIFMPYLILYYTEALNMENYVLIMAPAIVLASVFTVFYGKIYDKKGFKFSILPSIFLLIIGYLLLFFLESTAFVFIGSLLMMCGYLSSGAVFGAMIRDYTPENKAGMFQGLRIVGQVLIPGVIGPALGAAVLKNAEQVVNNDGTVSFIPNQNIFAAALVVAILLVAFLFIEFFVIKKVNKSE